MEKYIDDEIVLHSEGFVEGKTGWSMRKSGAFELFAYGKLKMRTALHGIDPRFLIIDKSKSGHFEPLSDTPFRISVEAQNLTINETTTSQGSAEVLPVMHVGEVFCERSARLEIVLALIKAGCNPSVATQREAGRLYAFVSGGNSEAGEQ